MIKTQEGLIMNRTAPTIDADTVDGSHAADFAAVGTGVTNGNSHDHSGGDGAQINHTTLSNVGTNTHAQVDSHVASTSNPHSVTAVQAGAAPTVHTHAGGDITSAVASATDADTVDGSHAAAFATAGHNHDATYAPIAKGVTNGDTHDHSGGDGAQINHTTLSNIGTNTHAQVDTHLAAASPHSAHATLSGGKVPTTELGGAGADATKYLRGDQSWQVPGGGSGTALEIDITQTSHGFAVKDVLRLSGASTYTKAQSDSAANAEVVGMVSAVAGVNDFTLTVGGRITGLTGLTANTVYFLDPSTAGAITATEPSTTGQISKPCFWAETTTSGLFYNQRGVVIVAAASPLSGSVVQVVNYQTGAYASGNTPMPADDTIPQNTEGDEYMTCAITPTKTTNKLKIDVVFNFSTAADDTRSIALFQDSTVNALASTTVRSVYSGGATYSVCFSHFMTAGTTSSTTFKIRAGGTMANANYFNSQYQGGTRVHGGVSASSITITEIQS